VAAGIGAEVYVLDTNPDRLRRLSEFCPPNVHPIASSAHAIAELAPRADVVIGAVLVPGGKTPILVTEKLLGAMEPGSVIIDVAVDQGGCVETAHPTTHSDPTYIHAGMVHYCVSNMPGAVAQTSTRGLTNATLPYLKSLATKGWRRAIRDDPALAHGLNVSEGRIRHAAVAETFGLEAEPLPAA
jgi:alanine dehydrogenase